MAGQGFTSASRPTRAGTLVRFALGLAQIAGVGFSLGLLISSGFTPLALAAVLCTCLLTALSLVLSGRQGRR